MGPAATVDDALDLIEATKGLDCAVLDLNLQGEMAYPVADELLARKVPFVFATGYDASSIPERFGNIVRHEKPIYPLNLAKSLVS